MIDEFKRTAVCMHISGDRKYYTGAKLLFISMPAQSLYISNLENILGIRLFERIGKSFVLTQAGELYVEKARQMLSLKESFDYGLSEIVNGQNERLRVGIQDIRSHFLTASSIALDG